jgi:O-6-methylguanine DNA methyltransferase
MGLKIHHGVHPSPFGDCFVASTERGICRLNFADPNEDPKRGTDEELDRLLADWPRAELISAPAVRRPLIASIFAPSTGEKRQPIHLLVRGTNFQVQVWRALLGIPHAAVVSYGDVAEAIGRPRSVRAVAGAVAANPIAYLIPCHRVLRASGAISGYRWGPERKRALLAWEAAGAHPSDTALRSRESASIN